MKALEGDLCVALAMLRRQINPQESPLYRLPPDLFPEVASYLANETDLVNATHVSYYLRNTLLHCQSLWSHLNFEHEMMARAFFERSGQVPLHVDMSIHTTRTVGSLTELRQQSRRIATLKLRDWSIQKKFLSEPLPSLRRLYDHGWDEEWDTTWAPVWGPMKEETSWSFPSLTSLIIYGLDPISLRAPNLTRFKFWDLESFTNTAKLLIFLSDCPLLEHIDISYPNTEELVSDPVVSLPSLRTYTQTDFGEKCSLTLFDAVSLPPFCSVTLRSWEYSGAEPLADYVLPPFKNMNYLTEIKRVKLGTTLNDGGYEVAGTLELINAMGTRMRSEIMISEEERKSFVQEDGFHAPNTVHLNSLENLDGQSVELLWIDGSASGGVRGTAAEFLREVLGFGGVRKLILSGSAVGPCLLALNEDPGKNDHKQWFSPTHTLIVHSDSEEQHLYNVLTRLLSIAKKRQVVGFPFKSVLLFLRADQVWVWDQFLRELKSCVEKLEVVLGDDDVDKYFLDGLEHLQGNQYVEWD